MFGGLEIKAPAGGGDKKEEKQENGAARSSSVFSFMNQTSPPAPAPPPAPAVGSAFSFLSSSTTSGEQSKQVDSAAPAPAASGFSFLSSSAPAPAPPAEAEPAKSEAPVSSFGFLTGQSSAAEPTKEDAPPSSAFSFLGGGNKSKEPEPSVEEPTKGTGSATSSISELPPSTTSSASDLMSSTTLNPSVPTISGTIFAPSAATSKPGMKKRIRSKKPGMMASSTTMPAAPAELPPTATAAATRPETQEPPDKDSMSIRALEAARRADAFILEKQLAAAAEKPPEEQNPSHSSGAGFEPPAVPPAPAESSTSSEQDKEYLAAMAAAQEAAAMNKRPFGKNIMSVFARNTSGSRSIPPPKEPGAHDGHDVSRQKEAEEQPRVESSAPIFGHVPQPGSSQPTTTSITEPSSVAKQPQWEAPKFEVPKMQQPQWEAPKFGGTKTEAPDITKKTPEQAPVKVEPPKPKTPEDVLEDILANFATSTREAVSQVVQLRKQRALLVEQRAGAEKMERLATQQIAQAELLQTEAAEQEFFDQADRLAAVIDRHMAEKMEQVAILANIDNAITEWDNQRDSVASGVTDCFRDVQIKLKEFQKEQLSIERADGTEAMKKFEEKSRKIQAEHERLNNDLKLLERDEALVEEERSEVEASITEQTADEQKLREGTNDELMRVAEEIDELRRTLHLKEALQKRLQGELVAHDAEIEKIRSKFSRQVARVQKKEMAVKENRSEWKHEMAQFENMKAEHEEVVKAHSDALLAHETVMKALEEEIANSVKMETVLSNDIVFETNFDEMDDSEKGELSHLQAEVAKCEAATNEANLSLIEKQEVVEGLRSEIERIVARAPTLEATKKAAAARRDFKAAGLRAKELKEDTARRQKCEELLSGEAMEQCEEAKRHADEISESLKSKQAKADALEKKIGEAFIVELAAKIRKLVARKKEVCADIAVDSDKKSVISVGALVLQGEIDALRMKGEIYGAKYGGWEDLMDKIEDLEDPEFTSGDGTDSPEETATEEQDTKETPSEEIPIAEKLKKFKDLTQRLQEAETALEEAVEKEEYETAAELDDVFKAIGSEIEALGLTDAEMEQAMTEGGDEDVADRSPDQVDEPDETVVAEEADEDKGALDEDNTTQPKEDAAVDAKESAAEEAEAERVNENTAEDNDEVDSDVKVAEKSDEVKSGETVESAKNTAEDDEEVENANKSEAAETATDKTKPELNGHDTENGDIQPSDKPKDCEETPNENHVDTKDEENEDCPEEQS